MKTIKLLVLSFCLLSGSCFTFVKSEEDPCVNYERVRENLERYDRIIAEKEMSPKEEDIKKLEELKKLRNDLVKRIEELAPKCSEKRLKEALAQAKDDVDKQKPEIDRVTRDYFAHKVPFDEYLKFFKNLKTDVQIYAYRQFENEVYEIGKLVEKCDSDMTTVINILKYRIKEETGYTPNINPDNFKIRKDNPNYFSEKINEKVNNSLSDVQKQKIQQMFDSASKRNKDLEEEKRALLKRRNELQRKLEILKQQKREKEKTNKNR
ncbi:MAG: hypothetical protein IJS73_00420 [Paludibacteraceae bacterium]|nr:hypothetical protein [Paludibacteraceae bacterium]